MAIDFGLKKYSIPEVCRLSLFTFILIILLTILVLISENYDRHNDDSLAFFIYALFTI